MQTLLYSVFVHAVAAGIIGMCVLVGCAFIGGLRCGSLTDGVVEFATRLALGIVAGSTIVVLLGLAHVLSVWSAWSLFVLLMILGAIRQSVCQGGTAVSLLQAKCRVWIEEWRRQRSAFRIISGVTVFALLAVMLNVMIGALCPDVQRDSMWYHLTMPGQWLIRGDVAMLPYCMPSTYTLGVEAFYALIIPLGDTLFITAFIAHVHLVTLLLFLSMGWRFGGMAGLLMMAALVPLAYGSSFAIAPIPSKPDPITVYLLGVGWWRLARLLDEPSRLSASELALAGVICGGAVAAKLSSLLVLMPLGMCFVVSWMLRARNARDLFPLILWPTMGALAVLLPWLIRAGLYSGNPVIHVARGLLPVAEEFAPALRGYDRVPMFHPLTSEGIAMIFTETLRHRIYLASVSLNLLFFFVPVAAIVSLANRRRSIRATGAGFVIAYVIWVPLLYGHGEEIRYFSVGVLAAAPALAGFCAEVARRTSSRQLPWLAGILLLSTAFTYVNHQLEFGTLKTVNWPFRPVVTIEDRTVWLGPTADGLRSQYYQRLDEVLPRDAHVLLPDSRGPFYLNRKAAWCDYFTCPMLDDWWPGFDGFAAHADLQARGISHIVCEQAVIDERILAMERENLVVPIPIAGLPRDWTVWIVTDS